ncbi:MAG: hypothetical protein NXY57DRAFT_966730 [Lentinula lateritia]|nr:MAG: hypothetical protein NXY57DRAFT_966730 [Lentinula lateritia]
MPNPRRHEMTNTPSNLCRSPALLTANTFKPNTHAAPGARLSMNTTRMTRRGGPVLIPSDDEDADPPFSNQSQIRQEYKNAQEDDSNGESDPNLDFKDAEMFDRESECQNHLEAATYFAEEGARFITQCGDFTVGTIGAALNQHGMTKKVQRMTAKLAGELPVVTPNHEETKPSASMPQSIEPTWLPHTSLVLKPSSDASWSHKLDLKSQNPQIRSVVKAATRQASLEVVINGSVERGYAVALRVIIERKTLKTGFSSVVLTAFGLDYSEESIEEAKRLVANSDYIYQLLPPTI